MMKFKRQNTIRFRTSARRDSVGVSLTGRLLVQVRPNHGGIVKITNRTRDGDSVPAGTFHGDSVPPGTFHGDSVPAGTFH